MLARWRIPDWSHFLVSFAQAAVRFWKGGRALLPSTGYRPERHYMRGPGPKSVARRSPSAADHEA
jgi:hypothetical protein